MPGLHAFFASAATAILTDVIEMRPNRSIYRTSGIGRIRIQPHPATSGLVCLWVIFDSNPAEERAMDIVDEHNIVIHPDQGKARYLCKASYPTGSED
jgi:hypothetical protein